MNAVSIGGNDRLGYPFVAACRPAKREPMVQGARAQRAYRKRRLDLVDRNRIAEHEALHLDAALRTYGFELLDSFERART